MFYMIILSCLLTCQAQFTDDLQIYEKECLGEDKFICLDEGCITHDQYCNGRPDCADGSDENFCPNSPPNKRLCNETHQFLCRDGHACIPATWVCNGEPDCTDASDESDCKPPPVKNTTVSKCGRKFECGDGTCISNLWTCDGRYDCEDRSDEDIETTCKRALTIHTAHNGQNCFDYNIFGARMYKCQDSSFCLNADMMCDNFADCRDKSDEGPFCDKWKTMCDNTTCPKFITRCVPERTGPHCVCNVGPSGHLYNQTSNECEDVDECQSEWPSCSQSCKNFKGHFRCFCEPGYVPDLYDYLCFAEGPEAMLFYSTEKDIRYIKVKTKEEVIVATGIKKSHGVSYDGKYLYWVETAEGHQAIARAHLDNVAESKQILVSLGLYDAGDIALDWLGRNIYFSDASRGAIYVCKADGSACTRIKTAALRPKFVTLDVNNGEMYWADVAGLQGGHLIMRAKMDGSKDEMMTASLNTFARGLALDALNKRLYFVDKTIMVIKTDTKEIYPLFRAEFHHPYALSVFENTVYWSDWTSNTIQTMDKLHVEGKKKVLTTLNSPVYGLHIYHPVLYRRESNPCNVQKCSHFCLLTSNSTYTCACPEGMVLNGTTCYNEPNFRPQYVIVGAGSAFTRIRYDTLGNPEAHATNFDIGRVQAMAYDNRRDTLYIYDGMRKCIVKMEMADFTLGVTHVFAHSGFQNVVDMDYVKCSIYNIQRTFPPCGIAVGRPYRQACSFGSTAPNGLCSEQTDHVTDNLYVLDSGRQALEVFSLKNGERALLHRFPDQEMPVSFCLVQHFGRLLVALVEREQNNEIHIDSMGFDGDEKEHQHFMLNNLRGPRVRLRNLYGSDMVAVSDEGSNSIEFIHLRTLPRGVRQDIRKRLPTAASSLAVTMPYVFWSDGRTPRIFWDEYLAESSTPRRVELSIFPNETHLHLQATTETPNPNDTLSPHPCARHPCSHICVRTPTLPILRQYPSPLGPESFRCLCPPGLILEGRNCTRITKCEEDQLYCHMSNECIPMIKRCDGEKDCKDGEDEEGCSLTTPEPSKKCLPTQIECNGGCIESNEICPQETTAEPFTPIFYCEFDQFQCRNSKLCLEREQVCDKHEDCPDGSDEAAFCHTLKCLDTEFMCSTGNCILGSWKCDGDSDCADGSDEVDCANQTCSVGSYQCRNGQCVDIQRRCDGQPDCFDGSDEERCQEPMPDPSWISTGIGIMMVNLTAWRVLIRNAARNSFLTYRCNNKFDCPGGTDEHGCDLCNPFGLFECKQEHRCISMKGVCNHNKDCKDGSDETPEACELVNRTSRVFFPSPYPPAECRHGFHCRTGQCIEWREVCDQTPDCFDGSDENGLCFTACENATCTDFCVATPLGPHCTCKPGYELQPDLHTCGDVDECAKDPCSQHCVNFPGSFLCSCHHGYTLRADRRSCKANIQAHRTMLFVSGSSARSMSELGHGHIELQDKTLGKLADIDFNFGQQKFYVTSPKAGKLIEVKPVPLINGTIQNVFTNIGTPTKMCVDWVTGNVYFVDNSTERSIRVCNFGKKRCARLRTLPSNGTVNALKVSPENRKLYYAINYEKICEITSVDLDGQNQRNSQFTGASVGMSVDGTLLYVASSQYVWNVDPGRSFRSKRISDWTRLTPEGIFVFEDYVFALSDHRFYRCLTYGLKTCIGMIFRMPEMQSFVVWHPSVQRPLKNECDKFVCENVCVLSQKGPKCVCEDGVVSEDGKCSLVGKNVLPLFNGELSQDFIRDHPYSVTLITITLFLFITYLAIFVYYHFVYRRRAQPAMSVRFQNQPSSSESMSSVQMPTLDMPTTSGTRHEFVNPLQYARNIWQRSFRRHRPIGTAGLSIDIPRPPRLTEVFSDTESMDSKDGRRNLIASQSP